MKRILFILRKARTSAIYLRLLNFVLGNAIPFNKPHRIKITAVHERGISVRLPYRRKNLNHLNGIHACALATTAEFTSGISLLLTMGGNYRLIMKSISVTYHFQAKVDVIATLLLDKNEIEEKIMLPMENQDKVLFENRIEVMDLLANHICTAVVLWQVKKWDKVSTPSS